MKFEKIRIEDIDEAVKLDPKDWSHIGPRLDAYIKLESCLSIKLSDENEIRGIGTAVSFKSSGWIGHLIVKDGHRGKGYGKAILNYLCDHFFKTGHKTISLFTTNMGYPMYDKYGFAVQTEYVQYEKTSDKDYIMSSNITNLEAKDYETILKMDRLAAGEDRSELLLGFVNDGLVYKQNNKITGFYLKNLGEGILIAETEEAGEELIKLRMTTRKQATVPIENNFANSFFSENKYKKTENVRKMMYGEKIKGKYENIFNRAGGSYG